jgi:hypothetical protein
MLRLAIVLGFAFLTIVPALAGPTCTLEPREKWLSERDMKAKIAQLGYRYRVFKVTDGNCYEIYGQDRNGKRIEIYFDPISGAVVEEHKS